MAAPAIAVTGALIGRGIYNLDEFRDAVERIPAQEYLASSYYERWLRGITTLLAERGIVTAEDLADG